MARKSDTHQTTDAVVDHALTATSSKKKRKRKERESTDAPEDSSVIVDADGLAEATEHRKKKRKKKRHAIEENQEHEHIAGKQTTSVGPELDKKKKKKKKKNRDDEHKEDHRVEPPSDAHIDPSLAGLGGQANAEAFLSAVVTAAAGSSVQQSSAFALRPSSFESSSYQNLPPGLGGPAVSFSGEDLARALQSLDVAKLADALHALGEAGNCTFPLPGQPGPALQHLPRYAYGHGMMTSQMTMPGSSSGNAHEQLSAPSATSLGQPSRNPGMPSASRKVAPVSVSYDEDHRHLLANKWLSATRLNELSKTIGLQYKKGKFSASEEALLQHAIENYRMKNSLTQDQLNEVIFAKGQKDKDNAFWFDITAYVPSRPVVAVYHHVRRSFHPLKQQGKWMPAEDDALRQAVADLGQSWEKVSQRVGRMAGDCRDRWRNHINNREGRVFGAWSKEEEERLTQIVTEMTTAQGKDSDLDVFWTQVAARMGNSRGRQQCRIKWTDCLSKVVKNSGEKPRWSHQDAYILVHKIASMNVNDDSEIDWKLLSDDNWKLWSAHTLQRRWLTLKRSVRGHEEMSHQEIMDILCAKNAHPPPMPTPVKRRVTSAPIVPPDAQASDVAIEETFPLASTSSLSNVDAPAYGGMHANEPPPQTDRFVLGGPVDFGSTGVAENSKVGRSNAQRSDEGTSSSSSSDSDTSDSD